MLRDIAACFANLTTEAQRTGRKTTEKILCGLRVLSVPLW